MNTGNSPKPKDRSFWHYLFNADSIAVIGAKETPGTWGHDAMRASVESAKGKAGRKVYAVNPNEKKVLGIKSYKSILDIPGPVELAVIVVPAPVVPEVFRQCAEKKVKAAAIISAGFAEVDGDGARLQEEIEAIARESGIRFVGPNCIGHSNMHSRVASVGFADRIPAGPMALLSQSGTLGASIMQIAASRGIGLSKFVSTGNEADLHLEDYLEYLADDKDTQIIGLYIEGLREGRRFFNLAKEITKHKPIVAVKSGTTEAAAKAAKSHTGTLAGSDAVYSAAFKQAGIIRAEDEEELCDTALCLCNLPLPRGNRVAILTMGGGFGVVTAEVCEKEGLEITELEAQTLRKMKAVLPPRWTPGNPVDLVGIRPAGKDNPGDTCLQLLLEDKNVDAIISLVPPMMFPPQMMAQASPTELKAIQRDIERNQAKLYRQLIEYGKPLVYIRRITISLPKELWDIAARPKAMIPEYNHPRRAARVLRSLAGYRKYLESR
ncbi:MAG: CoA-binding protein [Dehalococcoidales bacterium]|nr:CoA-binding protein [Dehalococcoidales bacterium]